MITILALSRFDVADFLRSLLLVYTLLIIAYILQSMFFSFGGRMPYNRYASAVIEFLNQTVGPFLAFFRRFIPMLGPLDLSPMVGIFALNIVGGIFISVIEG